MEKPPAPENDKIGPWTRLATRPIYENPWISVREDKVIHPDGSPGIFGVVSFRNQPVAIVAIDDENLVVLVGQYRYALDGYFWEIPQGGRSPGDSVQASAARELHEETGYSARRWDYLGQVAVSDSVTDEVGDVFLARDLTAGLPEPEASEELTVKRVPLEEAFRMAMDGELVETMTVIGLSRARYFLEREKHGAPPPTR